MRRVEQCHIVERSDVRCSNVGFGDIHCTKIDCRKIYCGKIERSDSQWIGSRRPKIRCEQSNTVNRGEISKRSFDGTRAGKSGDNGW
ncbi:MAG: hypothetical protein VKI42_06555 [Synechococcaceae cyanobacterium]|nr:hypothetical protein [Synechococcaceae cyanobacterium]